MRFQNPWSSEEELAATTRSALEAAGWTVYPESCGFDLFAVAGRVVGIQRGDTLGVEVKLDAGVAAGLGSLMRQILPAPRLTGLPPKPLQWWRPKTGPHYLVAVTARIQGDGRQVLERLGVAVWTAAFLRRGEWRKVNFRAFRVGVRFEPEQPIKPPEVVVDVPAGVPSPQTGNDRRIAQVALMLRLRDGELLTRDDFAAAGEGREIVGGVGWWRTCRWIEPSGQRRGRLILYRASDGWKGQRQRCYPNPPDVEYPEIAEALRAQRSPLQSRGRSAIL